MPPKNMGGGNPRVADFRRYFQSVDPVADELIGACIWDRQLYTSATTTLMTFFTQARATLRDGNLTIGAQLPDREYVLVRSIRVVPIIRPDQRAALTAANEGQLLSIADDLAQLYNDGVMQFKILSKDYGQYPMFLLLPGTGIVANQTSFTTTAQASNYGAVATVGNPDNRSVFSLAVPIPIPPQTGFRVTLEWTAALTLEAGNMNLEVVLDGSKIRPKQ